MTKTLKPGKGSMRDEMPITAAWIDDMRATFGVQYINNIILRGMRGEPVFSAKENGYTIGTPVPPGAPALSPEAETQSVQRNFSKWES